MKKLLFVISFICILNSLLSQETIVYFSVKGSKTIKSYKIDTVANKLVYCSETTTVGEPFAIAINSTGSYLVASMLGTGNASSYSINSLTGALTPINTIDLVGDACYLSLSASEAYILTAYFSPGKIAAYSIGTDGTLGSLASSVSYGTYDYPHSIANIPKTNITIVPQLGTSKILQYTLNESSGVISALTPASISTTNGSGPRHVVYHPTLNIAYFSLEMASKTAVCDYSRQGLSTPKQIIDNLPKTYTYGKWSSDIHITPNGEYLYTANRVKDSDVGKVNGSITAFSINKTTGELFLIDTFTTENRVREFDITPDGKYLIAAGEISGIAVLYKIGANGNLIKVTTENVGIELWWVKSVMVR